ncbi:fumarylacetoacetate hydrolase [Amnibacterium flavum]|uniref:Fumarylacetoacetate hydrolase n=1 Tax=Amnibacterium flavum TaxID=2173173 RepID=A0A2V1HVL2_9MICO|nr:fumarylacetoacetate hydrolase [Amnibacterium flavum]
MADLLPADGYAGALAGRVWLPSVEGPAVVAVREDGLYDLSASAATMRVLFEADDPAALLASIEGVRIGALADVLANTPPESRDTTKPWLLSPIDLQVVKAAGVTFAVSMVERVIEEKARGDAELAEQIRGAIAERIGSELRSLIPGSEQAAKVKEYLIEQDLWSQYLEVGIGPDAEIFTKAPVLGSVGTAVEVGIHSSSTWNNPEPEVVLAISSSGRIVGATLGNDVNLRDVEGRSALLLPKAKDNNASAALGPFIRFFDDGFGQDDLRQISVDLLITGKDGFRLEATSPLSEISRDPADLAAQLVGPHHQYPDGAVLYLGTLFAPIVDRGEAGRGFTHKRGDIVRISAPQLGGLVNRVATSESAEPWTFGIAALMTNLAGRGLL